MFKLSSCDILGSRSCNKQDLEVHKTRKEPKNTKCVLEKQRPALNYATVNSEDMPTAITTCEGIGYSSLGRDIRVERIYAGAGISNT